MSLKPYCGYEEGYIGERCALQQRTVKFTHAAQWTS
jgi:hypothetical protein